MSTHPLTLPIRRPIMTTNEARSQHWRNAHRAKHETEALVRSALVRARIRTLAPPIAVSVTWYAPNLIRRDSDSVDFTKKAVLDALVKTGVIPDDDWKHVIGASTAVQLDRDNPRIEIVLEETTP